MREIPKLQVLCLRAVGAQSCSAEETFASNQQTNEPSQASKLLRSFHQRPTAKAGMKDDNDDNNDDNNDDKDDQAKKNTPNKTTTMMKDVPMTRSVVVGKGSSRRAQANDVDLNHPLIAHHSTTTSTSTSVLVMEHGTPALDCLQSYIDSLVELGRMDDNRLGVHFFEEWRNNVLLGAGKPIPEITNNNNSNKKNKTSQQDEPATDDTPPQPPPRKRTRRRGSNSANNNNNNSNNITTSIRLRVKQGPPPPLGSLSLNNCAIAGDTIEAMRDSGMGIHIGVLDLTGIYGLNDHMLEQLLPHCPHLQRFSVKNCRRVTVATLQILAQYQTKLRFLDIGGTYNIAPDEVIDTIVVGNNNSNNNSSNKRKKSRPCPDLIELHVSGLGWNDHLLKTMVCCGTNDEDDDDDEDADEGTSSSPKQQQRQLRPWKALSFGFSMNLTSLALRQSLSKVSSSLVSLALHFCEYVVDNALMGMLGRNLPHVRFLDVRGNPSLNSMTGWYDGRASADFTALPGASGDDNNDNNTAAQTQKQEGDESDDEEGNSNVVVQELTVLARFTGITKASLEDTLRIHPLHAAKLKCIIDSSGTGVGIYR